MDKVIVDVPSMYADHHVLVVRNMLGKIDGVKDIYASAAFKQVLVQFDSTKVQAEAITNKLVEAGYTNDMQVPVQTQLPEDAWKQGSSRMTQTNEADLIMSGEHRKY